jgi:phage baseplate assembly protein W
MMGTNFKIPFQLTAQGTVATTIDPNEIGNDRIEALIGTYPGERVMQPSYGVNLPMYLFTPDIIESTDLLSNEITSQVSKWEPSITLLDITPVTTQEDQGIAQVNVEFTISNDPTLTPSLVATVEVGGKVVNN